ncbi:FAD:protein FMN transferase [Paenibacillus anaericanus]|uniref:FAD:protein FMN transferase n=1 Tax=Paenibacillus anaericanus TaxID=170367 RepID=A0A433YEY2_9BACL|nr:FAD:protein FMN transferase [Paenibacillus anaericanus]RUT48442.1 FAD:protein FMN transferase [Paenibacillus anaericanus]
MKKYKLTITLTTLALFASLLSGCFGNNNNAADSTQITSGNSSQYETLEPLSQTYFIFDTVVNVKIYDTRATKDNLQDIENILKNIDQKISRNQETSEISKVNAKSGIAAVKVSEDTYDLVSKALEYAERTDGLFDPAIGKLVGLWNIGHEGAHVPAKEDIAEALLLSDYRKVEMNDDTHEIYLQEKGMDIDLGSIGKGYAADVIYDYLTDKGFNSAIIDLGGNVFAMGSKPGGKKWTVGVQDPDKERGNPIGTIQVEDKTIVTSGIYERFFIEDGKLYQHILNPTTGYPVDNNISSVTIVTNRSTDADALSTTLFVLGIEEGLKFIENTPDAEALFISKDKKLYGTSGFKKLLNKTNDSYTFAN